MLMSKSRLEKFLYALYSLDSSDLPTPLSRIEELYKCLVTGEEAPTFEPLSRVEKYLMAILGAYNVDELPNPLSRVEVLLYKLATGDDNLDDVKSFLSEHEELLADIIRNGGTGGNIDIEYVLYNLSTEFNTLYNTAKKPVKSAILKGQTLVNLLSESNINVKSSNTYRINYTQDLNTTKTYILQYRINQIPELSDTTDSARLLKFEWYSGNKYGGYSDIFIRDITVGNDNFIMINPFNDEVTKTYFGIWCPNYVSGSLDMDIILIEYQDGMENWDIPYFEGMQSVKMPVLTTTGKNLFPTNNFLEYGTNNQMVGQSTFEVYLKSGDYCSSYVHADDSDKDTILRYKLLDEQDNQVLANGPVNRIFTIENDGLYKLQFGRSSIYSGLYTKIQVQLEEGSVETEYEPYKSNILTVNEDIELRGIGEVKDELDLVTGEVTQRIGEYSLDGSSNNGKWVIRTDVYKEGYIYFQQELNYILQSENIAICDRLPYSNQSNISSEQLRLSVYNNETRIGVRLSESKGVSSLDEFSEYLKSNPIKFKYPLATASIKTVDLSVVNQDGNNTKLSTFNDITHVILSSEGLIPEAELEVATKNEEDLEVAEKVTEVAASMLTISREQEVINATTNEQSENVDSTMIATTEIYEELL